MEYELIVTRQQPTCGNQQPSRSEILMVQTEDPLAYVKSKEKAEKYDVSNPSSDITVIECLQGNGMTVKYEFTEV